MKTSRSLRRLFVLTGLSLTLGAAGLHAQAPLPVWQSSDSVVGTSGTITVTKPAGTAVNDLIFVSVVKSAGAAGSVVTAPGGWVASLNTGASTQLGISTFYRVAQAGEPASYDFSITGGVPWVASITRITGAHRTSPIPHTGATSSLEAGTTVFNSSVTTTTANNLMLAFYSGRINGTFSTPASTTERYDVANSAAGHPSAMLATYDKAVAGFSPVGNSTMSASGFWIGAHLAVRPPQLATVSLSSLVTSNYTMTQVDANISDAGGCDILARGIVYSEASLDSTPTLGEANVFSAVSTATTNSYTAVATGLKAATNYYFRAYVTNEVGTAYSSPFFFTTNTPSGLISAFSSDGIHAVDLGDTDNAANLITQSDNKPLLLVNRTDAGRASIVRLTAFGTLDTGYDTDGRADLSVPGTTADALAGAALQNDGKLVAAGHSTFADGSRQIVVARFLTDGSPDTTFGSGGVVAINAANLEYGLSGANAQAFAADVALQTDGKIVVAGRVRRNTGGKDDGLVLRLNASGSLDTSFGGNGVVGVQATTTESTSFAGVEMQPDGKIVLGGARVVSGFDFQCLAARLTAAGALDTSFDTDGLVLFDANLAEGGSHNEIDQVMDVKLAPDGGILLAIQAETAAFNPRYFVARLNRSNGALDSGFGGNGVINTGVAGSVAKMEVQGDGRILLAGGNSSFNTTVLRLLPTGAFDTDWDTDGSLTNTTASSATGISASSNGTIYVCALDNAFSGGSAYAYRFRGDGVVAPSTLAPADNASGVDVNASLSMTLGTPLVPLSGNIEIIHAHTFAVVESIPVGDPRVTGADGGTLTINPDATLAGNTKYYVRVPHTGFRAANGLNNVRGISNTEWEFTTATPVLSSNADLSTLALSAGTLDPAFASGTTAYTATVTNPTASLTVTPTRADPGASIQARVNGGGYAPVTSGSPSGPLALNVGPNTVEVLVTAEDGTTMKTYTVTVTRESAPTDITLSASSIAENNAANATVGTLGAVGGASPHTFSFATGNGDADNGSFNILGTALRLTDPADFEAKSSYALRVQVEDDNGYTFAKELTVTITNLNETPSFTKGADQVHTVDSGAKTVTGWATAIDDGDSTVTQTVSFEITGNNNPGLFTTAPAVAANGTLTYTLSGTQGTATITLRIVDDTSIGGQPALASATQSFSITNQLPPGQLDTAFHHDGIVTTTFNTNFNYGRDLVVLPTGRIVMVGNAFNDGAFNFDFALARYTGAGDLDPTFGTGGRVTTNFGSSDDLAYGVAVQGDGKLVVAGSAYGTTNDFALARYHADGTLDTTFGTAGKVTTDFSSRQDHAYDVAVQADGKIVLAGASESSAQYHIVLARYTDAGALDTTFGTGGRVTTIIGGSTYQIANAVAVLGDGKILIGGYRVLSGDTDFVLVRYTSTGSLDATFGTGGIVTTHLGSTNDQIHDMTLQTDGKIVVAGMTGTSNFDFVVARYLETGVLDTTFGGGTGRTITAIGSGHDAAKAVALQQNGKVVVAGHAAVSGNDDFALARYTAAGVLDTTFGTGGKIILPIGSNADQILALGIQPNGKIVAGGYATSGTQASFALARFHGDLAAAPAIRVEQPAGQQVVYDGNRDFGIVTLGDDETMTFTVGNSGSADLNLTATPPNYITLGGLDAAQFSVTTQPGTASYPAGGAAQNFVITYAPTTAGRHEARVTIANTDTEQDPFTFLVFGEGLPPMPTDITLTPSSIAENNAADAPVGTLDGVDGTPPYSFGFAGGDGDADNGSFSIDGATLKLTPSADFEAKNSYSTRLYVQDSNGQTFEKALAVSVTNVNEAPTFTKGPNQVHTLDSGAKTVTGWATGIDDGDSTVAQTVSFEITGNNNPGLFTTAPAVAANGTLTYTLSGTQGTATITLRILDDTSIGGQPALASATQNFTITNQAAPNYVLTYAGGHLTCTDMSGNGDTLYLYEAAGEAGSVRFLASGRTFSVNGGLNTTTLTAPFAMADLNSVTINAGGGNDTIYVQSDISGSILSLPSLTIHGGTGDDSVSFQTSVTFKPNASLEVDLQDDDATPGTDNIFTANNVQLLLSGTGGAVFKCSRRLNFTTGTVLEVENGSILMEANLQATATAGAFWGLELFNARVEATGSGSVTLRGRSGNGGSFNLGVGLRNGTQVLAGAGGIVIEGGGQGGHSNSGNYGVSVGAGPSSAVVKAVGGDISITGVAGSDGAAILNHGLVVEGAGEVEATGAGKVTLHGTGGNTTGTGSSNSGIFINGASTRVTTEDGKLTLTGIGGGGAGSTTNHGVLLANALLVGPTGTGDLQITGTPGGAGAGHGLVLNATALLSSAAGDITLSGTAAPQGGDGVNLSNSVSADGGDISITGVGAGTGNGHDGISTSQLISTTGTGTVTLHGTAAPAGHGVGVILGNSTSTVQTGGGGISITGIGGSGGTSTLCAGVRVIGLVSGPAPGSSLMIHGTGGSNGQPFPHGVEFIGATADATTAGGDINITGIAGGGDATQAHGVNFVSGAGINAGAGKVILHGTGGAGTGSTIGVQVSASEVVGNGGIHITGVGGTGTGAGINLFSIASLVTTGGDITLHGTGSTLVGLGIAFLNLIDAGGGDISLTGISKGAGNNLHGIQRGGATTTTGTGTITMHGTASPDGHGVGVLLGGTVAAVTTGGGGISLTGIGGGAGTASNSSGVWVNGATVSGPGAGSALTIHGTGGASTQNYPHGVEVSGSGTTGKLLTSGGDIAVTGIGGPNNTTQSLGIQFHSGTEISAGGTGGITLNGTGGAAAGGGQSGVFFNSGTVSTNNGPIQVTGTAGGQGGVLGGRGIAKTSSATVTVGGDHDLTLVADSIGLFGGSTMNAAGNDVIIRQKTAGTAITLGAEDTVNGGPLVLGLSDAELDSFVADEVRIGNADTGAMRVAGNISPLNYPLLWLAKPVTFASGGGFISEITSEAVFDRMIVNGGITLEAGSGITGAVLGGFVPSATAVIPVIQGNDGVTGIFNGLPEGAPVSLSALGRRMRMTYAAGGGNHIAFYSSPIALVRGNNVVIAKGDATPSATDHTNFGGVLTAGSNTVVRTFEILNDGLAPLTGISPAVDAGTPAGAFTITLSPASGLISGASTYFSVTFDPAANGIQSSTVTVTSDQPLDSPYSFAIQGEGTYPEIAVYDGTVLGTQLVDDTGEVDFGDVERSTTGAARLFTIRNIGTGPMSGIAVTKGLDGLPAEFGLDTSGMSTSLSPNASTTFTVALTPQTLGPRGAVLEIASTDEDENPFEVNVIGEGVPPAFAATTDQFMLPDQGLDGGGRIYRPLTGVINQEGFITLRAWGAVGSGGITSANDSLLLSDTSGELRVVAREGGIVQTSPWQTLAGLFTHFVLTEGGESVALDRVAGAPTASDYAYIGSPDGVLLEILSREGDSAPSAGVFKTHTAKPAVDAQGRVYFSGDLSGAGITTKTDTGIYQESGGSVVEIIREGDDVSAQTGDAAWLGAVSNYVAAAGNGVVFTASLQNHPTDTTQKTDTARNAVVMAGNEAALAVIARKGDPVPGTTSTMRTFSGVSRASDGGHAFLGLMTSGGGVTTANDEVLVSAQSGSLHLVAREGVTQVSGVTLTKFGDFYACAGGVVIFEASGVLCRWTQGGGIEELARAGAEAPGMGGATFSSLGSLSVSAGGAVALVTPLSSGQSALWRALPGDALSLVSQTSDVIVVDGTPQTILGITIHAQGAGTGGGGGGMGAAINDDGYLFATLSLGGGQHVARVFP